MQLRAHFSPNPRQLLTTCRPTAVFHKSLFCSWWEINIPLWHLHPLIHLKMWFAFSIMRNPYRQRGSFWILYQFFWVRLVCNCIWHKLYTLYTILNIGSIFYCTSPNCLALKLPEWYVCIIGSKCWLWRHLKWTDSFIKINFNWIVRLLSVDVRHFPLKSFRDLVVKCASYFNMCNAWSIYVIK